MLVQQNYVHLCPCAQLQYITFHCLTNSCDTMSILCVIVDVRKCLYILRQWQYHISLFSDGGVDRRPAPETEETNYIEPEPEPVRDTEPQPRSQTPNASPNDNLQRNQVVSTEQMCKDGSHHASSF